MVIPLKTPKRREDKSTDAHLQMILMISGNFHLREMDSFEYFC